MFSGGFTSFGHMISNYALTFCSGDFGEDRYSDLCVQKKKSEE